MSGPSTMPSNNGRKNLRGALLISRGDWSVFLTRPLSGADSCRPPGCRCRPPPTLRRKRDEAFAEG